MHLQHYGKQEQDAECECLVLLPEFAAEATDYHLMIADHVVQLVDKPMTCAGSYPGEFHYIWIALRI